MVVLQTVSNKEWRCPLCWEKHFVPEVIVNDRGFPGRYFYCSKYDEYFCDLEMSKWNAAQRLQPQFATFSFGPMKGMNTDGRDDEGPAAQMGF